MAIMFKVTESAKILCTKTSNIDAIKTTLNFRTDPFNEFVNSVNLDFMQSVCVIDSSSKEQGFVDLFICHRHCDCKHEKWSNKW